MKQRSPPLQLRSGQKSNRLPSKMRVRPTKLWAMIALALLPTIPRNAPPSPAPAPVGPAVAAGAGGFTDLSLMFNELKSELEEDTATTAAESDPETHYNLGVAFREMGLLDEAIGELQKVCQLADKGNSFSQLMQTYTWL